MKITALIENTASREDVTAEHGLSLFIETDKHNILFDMGQSYMFYSNALTLGIDLTSVDIAVLSHGHYDHGGGLKKFLEINTNAPVYIHKDAFLPHFNGTEKYIGLDTELQDNPRIIFTGNKCIIDDTLSLWDCNDKEMRSPEISHGLTEKTENGFIVDDFRHEQYLLIEENGKRVLISGCSHKGIRDITRWFSPDVLIGGFHFSKLPLDKELKNAASELASYPTVFYTCHCTGTEQYEFMHRFMPDLHYLACGETICI